MKKYLFFAAMAIVALASCSENEFVGDTPSTNSSNEVGAISFGTGVNTVTRAQKQGAEAATLLNNNFVFAGTKGTEATSFVFDQYTAHFVNNSAHSTESNSSNWEYVGYEPASTTSLVLGDNRQTIKYWDYATTQYDFAAYSLGSGSADASAINASTKSFTLTGSADDLKACYISDLVTYYNYDGGTANDATDDVSDYGKPVKFSFRSLAAKIRIAFYETIPGYSVKDVQFYSSADDNAADNTPTLYTSSAVLPSGDGTMTITYPTTGWSNREKTDYNKAHIAFAATDNTTDLASTLTFGALTNYPTTYEGVLSSGEFIGRTSNTATYADGGVTTGEGQSAVFTPNAQGTYYTVLPNETGANLQLRIKYTLVSTDKSGETITVDKATAVVPAEFAKWNPNYAYTYIFKIGDMTNGTTGVNAVTGQPEMGLTPITLDAVVVDSEDGVQETITTVSKPSITTYMAGKVITNNDEYITGKTIYIIVNNGTSNETLTVGTNAYLYTVTLEEGAAQTITEESVENALINGSYDSSAKTYTVTDAKGKTLVVTDTESSLLTASTKIEKDDSPTGNEISVTGAKFTAGSAGTIYAFQYIKTPRTLYTSDDASTIKTHNDALPGAISTSDKAYSFNSYGDENGTTTYGSGKVKELSKDGEWTTVLVTSNDIEGFVGKEYKVHATTLNTETFYPLYTTAGAATGIYVKVSNYTYVDTDVNTYNATLPGAVKVGDVKTPGEYGYKIIKIAQ